MMVESGGIRVDWFDGGGKEKEAAEDGMEVDVRKGEEEDEDDGEDEGGRRKRRALMMMGGKKQEDEETAEDRMLELRLSLAVAISVPSPHCQQSEKAGAYVVHPHQQNHMQQVNDHHSLRHSSQPLQQQQQQQQQPQTDQLGSSVGRRIESPAKRQLMLDAPSSPVLDGQRGSPRPNLTASLKHLVSQQQQQQQPSKVKPAERQMSHGTMVRAVAHPPFYLRFPPAIQLPHLPAALLRASASHLLQDGHEAGHESIGRLVPDTSLAALPLPTQLLRFGVHGPPPQPGLHANATQQSLYPRGYPPQQQGQLGPPSATTTHRVYSPSASPVNQLQHSSPISRELGLQLRGVPPGQETVPSTLDTQTVGPLPFAINVTSHTPVGHTVASPRQTPLLQHLNAVTVAAHPPSQPAAFAPGSQFSAFSVVPPSSELPLPISFGDRPSLRERSCDNHVVVNICDRKVRLTSQLDASSLYSLCRRWVRNDVLRRDQLILWDCRPLPRPLSVAEARTNRSDSKTEIKQEPADSTEVDWPGATESLTPETLLKHHVRHCKAVRKRFREHRAQRIERFLPRLALLLPGHTESNKLETFLGHSRP